MTDRIDHAAEAQKVLAMPTSVTEIAFCACGARCENEDDGGDGFLAGYWRHIAELTEQAVREQIAAQIEAQPPEYFSATMITKALAAEIARGRS